MRRVLAVLFLALVAPAVFAQADQEVVSVVDSPDPITPGQVLTYTITMRNNGPNPAVNGGFNTNLPGELTYINTTAPAGFTCATFGAAVSCTTPSFAPGTVVFTMTATVNASLLNFPDGSFGITFSPSGVTPDPTPGNNNKSATTSYDSPQIDLNLTVTDAPDPVFPDGNITYTVPVRNDGPDAATNVNFSTFNNGSLKFQSATVPAGWNCTLPAVNGNPTFNCTNPSFAGGATSNFTVVVKADSTVLGVNDGTVGTVFGVNGTGNDTNQTNNQETENTAYTTPDADVQITASDSPDPVFPDGNITYTVTVTNAGPDAAPSAVMNVPLNNTLRFQSITIPAGWSCNPPPAVGSGASFTCTNPSLANGASSIFTIVLNAGQAQFGINDQTINQAFTAGSGVSDPNNNNNAITVSTLYSTPDANMAITASDAPDPVVNGANVTFTIGVTNGGPDAAPNATMTASPDASLTFQSITAPAGWNCTTPAVDAAGVVQCTNPSLANGVTANFTLVTKVVKSGAAGGTLSSTFVTGSNVQDPSNTNNSVTVFTNWIGQTSDLSISKNTLSSAAAQGGTITYTISTTNAGPDAASNVTVTDVLHASLRFQSIAAPAGWSCSTPAVGANGTVTCSIAVFPNGATANFTLVTTVAPNATGTITNSASAGFTGGSDPVGGNSSGAAASVIVGGNADLVVSKTTGTTTIVQGGTISYTVNVTNNGPEAAASVVMTDILPAALRFSSIAAPAGWSCTTPAIGTNGTVTCNAATLANGATATFTLVTTVAPTASGPVTNTASASHSGNDANSGNSSGPSTPTAITPSAAADLSLAKSTQSTSAATGSTITYTLTVNNAGPSPATNVVVTDTIASSLTLLTATPSQGSCSGTTTVTCNLGTLANLAGATVTITARVVATSGTVANSAIVSATESDPNGGNNTGTAPPLPVVIPTEGEASIPTLSEWALLALAAMLLVVAARKV